MLQLLINGLCKGGIYTLVALGFGLIYSSTRVMHIAHAGVFAGAAYGLYFSLTNGAPLWLGIALACLVGVTLGLLIEHFVYWPLSLRRAPGTVLLISSLGVQIVLINVITSIFGNAAQMFQNTAEPILHLGAANFTRIQLMQFLGGLLGTAALAFVLWRTALGKSIRALADDPVLATILGIPVRQIRLAVVAIGSLFAATGACLLALDVGADPYSGFPIMLTAAIACIIGGLHHLLAPALGAVLLGVTQSVVVWTTSGRWEEAVTFGLLVVFLVFRPQGFLGVAIRVDK